jgi:hypothetical protein
LPCDVGSIIRKNCAMCHGATPLFGAPFSLATAADIRRHGKDILEAVAATQIEAGKKKPMPPTPNPRLTTEEQAVLAQYINAGAPASSCTDGDPTPDDPTLVDPPQNTNPDVTCYKVTARASKAGDKFAVPMEPDLYQCFNYAPPWGNKKIHIVSARPIIDNARILHHWLLYNLEGAADDGTNSGCIGAHPNAALIAGWAPGGEPTVTPDDVGIVTSTGGFVLETHYNNTVDNQQADASGVEVCVTEKLRPKEAAVHWLGTQGLNKLEAVGQCVPTNTGDVTILSSIPHMHVQGRNMKVVINRAGGGTETLYDKPFDFNNQVGYKTPAVIKKGDTLTTTCSYATPTAFGEGTNQEMCYSFTLAYPAGALSHGFSLLRKYDCASLF